MIVFDRNFFSYTNYQFAPHFQIPRVKISNFHLTYLNTVFYNPCVLSNVYCNALHFYLMMQMILSFDSVSDPLHSLILIDCLIGILQSFRIVSYTHGHSLTSLFHFQALSIFHHFLNLFFYQANLINCYCSFIYIYINIIILHRFVILIYSFFSD